MGTQLTNEQTEPRGVLGRDFDGAALVRGPGWPARWYRVPRSQLRSVVNRQRWIPILTIALPAALSPILGLTGFIASVAVAAGIGYAALGWVVRGLEQVPAERLGRISKPRLEMPWVRKALLYWSAVGYMSALGAASIYLALTGEPLLGVPGAVVCGGCVALFIRERRKAAVTAPE